MAGILDKKTRFIDLVITQEGKRQIASGELQAEYVSLTDMHSFYEKHQTAREVSDKIYFEVAERPENSIVLEKNDSGRLIQQDVIDGMRVTADNNIIASVLSDVGLNVEGDATRITHILATGSQFSSLSERMSKLTINHFNNNFLLGTDLLKGNNLANGFSLSKENIDFVISNSIPFKLGPQREIANIDDSESFIEDKKMANLPNFSFLPPVNEDGTSFGNYTDVRNISSQTFDQIIKSLGLNAFNEIEVEESEAFNVKKNTSGDLKVYNREDQSNFTNFIKKEYETIKFTKTSLANNILVQFHEIDAKTNKITKLDMLDGGLFTIADDINNRNEKHVFYIGKIYFDTDDIPKFINIFTLIFD